MIDSMGLVVPNAQEYLHYSVVNVALWATEMDHYWRGHVAVVVEDVRLVMAAVVGVDQASKN